MNFSFHFLTRFSISQNRVGFGLSCEIKNFCACAHSEMAERIENLALVPQFEHEEDEREEGDEPVLLGFFEPQIRRDALLRNRFPSKAGGHPAWLNPRDIPNAKDMLCSNCSEPLRFILQIYAPLPESHSYHRTIYLFCCDKGDCIGRQGSIKVFRSQLPKENDFYPSGKTISDNEDQVEHQDAQERYEFDTNVPSTKLCVVCGTRAPKTCSRCHGVSYCSKEHQKIHWFDSHSKLCKATEKVSIKIESRSEDIVSPIRKLAFPQFEIVIEEEEYDLVHDISKQDFTDERELLHKYNSEVKSLNKKDMNELREMDFENDETLDAELEEFQRRIKPYPNQCVRYCRGYVSSILWMGSRNILDFSTVPRCQHCSGKMIFEFQVLPQVLHYFNVDGWEGSRHCTMDWGSLVIFTCQNSCGDGSKSYFTEFAYCQKSPASMIAQ
jgi:pre-rRNA-processing protein TSR4